jgi:hypothetical protein
MLEAVNKSYNESRSAGDPIIARNVRAMERDSLRSDAAKAVRLPRRQITTSLNSSAQTHCCVSATLFAVD